MSQDQTRPSASNRAHYDLWRGAAKAPPSITQGLGQNRDGYYELEWRASNGDIATIRDTSLLQIAAMRDRLISDGKLSSFELQIISPFTCPASQTKVDRPRSTGAGSFKFPWNPPPNFQNRPVIYLLEDPDRPVKWYYIGQTVDLRQRVYGHCTSPSGLLACAIDKLRRRGRFPRVSVLETVGDRANLNEAESRWIFIYRDLVGCRLLNIRHPPSAAQARPSGADSPEP